MKPPNIRILGRLHFAVQSASRPDIEHAVDMEPNEYGDGPACSCECNRLRLEECPHIRAVVKMLEESR